MAKDNACDRGWIRHCGQDRRPLLPIQASFANAAQFFNSLLDPMPTGLVALSHLSGRARAGDRASVNRFRRSDRQ